MRNASRYVPQHYSTKTLGPREQQVLDAIAEGKLHKENAAELGIAEKSVRNIVTGVFRRIAVERALILCRGGRLSFTWLESIEEPSHPAPSDSHVMPLGTVVAAHIRLALSETGGVVEGPNGAAALLQMNPSTLRHKMRRLGVRFGRET